MRHDTSCCVVRCLLVPRKRRGHALRLASSRHRVLHHLKCTSAPDNHVAPSVGENYITLSVIFRIKTKGNLRRILTLRTAFFTTYVVYFQHKERRISLSTSQRKNCAEFSSSRTVKFTATLMAVSTNKCLECNDIFLAIFINYKRILHNKGMGLFGQVDFPTSQ